MTNSSTAILPAGYIVTDNDAVWGIGANSDAAWGDFLSQMQAAGVDVLDDAADTTDQRGNWTLESDHTIRPASAALMAAVESDGGAVLWGMAGGVACTRAECEGL